MTYSARAIEIATQPLRALSQDWEELRDLRPEVDRDALNGEPVRTESEPRTYKPTGKGFCPDCGYEVPCSGVCGNCE